MQEKRLYTTLSAILAFSIILMIFSVSCSKKIPAAGQASGTVAIASEISSDTSNEGKDKSESQDLNNGKPGIEPEDAMAAVFSVETEDMRNSAILFFNGIEKNISVIASAGNNFSPVFSSGNNLIAFYSNMDGDYDIYTISPGKNDLKNLTANSSNEYMPRFCPDGKRICYQSDLGGNSRIYIMNTDGTDKFVVTNNNSENYGAIWSQDGRSIYYISNDGGDFDIYQINIDGSGLKRLTDDAYYEQDLNLSPDGSTLLYAAGEMDATIFEIFTLDLKTFKISRLTNNMSYSSLPLWASSKNSRKILFNSDMEGYSEIYSINTDGSGIKNLTNNNYYDRLIAVSPDGHSFFYQFYNDYGDSGLNMYDLENLKNYSILDSRPGFEKLKEADYSFADIFSFIDLNILISGQGFADEIVDFAIEYSENQLLEFTERFYKEDIQEKFWNFQEEAKNLAVLIASNDTAISGLARETLDRKYKLLGFEGFIEPLVDYMLYKKQYGPYLSDAMNAYIDIMAKESEKPSVADAGLTMSLKDYVERIIGLYEFEQNYPGFPRIYKIVNMISGSLWIYMGGIDNSPVFDFEGRILPERLADFKANEEKYKGSRFGNKLNEYLNLLESENYLRTQKVSDYINSLEF